MTETQRQKKFNSSSRLKRIILILVLAVAMSGAFDPGISDEIESSLGHSQSGFNTVQTIGLRFSRDCINTNTYASSDQSSSFERNGDGFDLYNYNISDVRLLASFGSNDPVYKLSLLLYLGVIICLLSFFHIFFIHLQDGKK